MNIYLIEIKGGSTDWDSNEAHVIACSNEQEARTMASEDAADEGPQIWFNENLIKIELVGHALSSKKRIILTSFKAG